LQIYKSYLRVLPKEGLTIRKAIAKDRDSIFEIFESQDTKWDIPYARKYYDNYFNDVNPGDMVFVGIVDGDIVAVTGYCPDSDIDDVYWLNWHYTHKDYEGKGIGGKLLEHVIEMLSPKIRKFYVNTGSRLLNLRALNLYLKKGFRIEAVLRDYYGEGEDQIMLGMKF
jgi:ribosomal protein S18 acetylase RimI-like enzyme